MDSPEPLRTFVALRDVLSGGTSLWARKPSGGWVFVHTFPSMGSPMLEAAVHAYATTQGWGEYVVQLGGRYVSGDTDG